MWNHVSWNALLSTYGLGVGLGGTRTSNFAVSLVSSVGLLGATFYFLAQGTLEGRAWVGPALLAVGLIIIAANWTSNLATTYEVTADRLILHKGILVKSIDEIELYRIKDVRLDYSLLNQMVDIGTITLTSTDRTTGDTAFVLRDVPMARERREGLRGLVERARQRRGVREIDMDYEGPPAG